MHSTASCVRGRFRSTIAPVAVLALMLPLVAGCATSRKESSSSTDPIKQVHERYTQRVAIFEQCPTSLPQPKTDDTASTMAPLLAAGLAAAVPVVSSFIAGAITDYAASLEKKRSATYLATGSGELPDAGTYCLVVARGKFGAPEKPRQLADKRGSLKPYMLEPVGLSDYPDFYMEADLELRWRSRPPAPASAPVAATAAAKDGGKPQDGKGGAKPQDAKDGTKPAATPPAADVKIHPTLLHFASTAAERERDEEKSIGMILILRSSTIAADADAKAAADGAELVFPINFKKVTPGQEIRQAQGDTKVSPDPFVDLVATAPLATLPASLNMYAFVTESAEPDKVLALINKALGKHENDISGAIKSGLESWVKTLKDGN